MGPSILLSELENWHDFLLQNNLSPTARLSQSVYKQHSLRYIFYSVICHVLHPRFEEYFIAWILTSVSWNHYTHHTSWRDDMRFSLAHVYLSIFLFERLISISGRCMDLFVSQMSDTKPLNGIRVKCRFIYFLLTLVWWCETSESQGKAAHLIDNGLVLNI